MKLSFTVLAILVVLSVVIPFLIFVFKGINNTTKTKQKAENLLKSNGFKYNLQEVWNTKFIGITQDKKVLSYIHFKDESETHLDINMDQIKHCEIVSDYRTDRDKVTRLKHLDLKITFNTSKKEAVLLSFFDTDEGFTEDYESRRIEKWHAIITSNLKHKIETKLAS